MSRPCTPVPSDKQNNIPHRILGSCHGPCSVNKLFIDNLYTCIPLGLTEIITLLKVDGSQSSYRLKDKELNVCYNDLVRVLYTSSRKTEAVLKWFGGSVHRVR